MKKSLILLSCIGMALTAVAFQFSLAKYDRRGNPNPKAGLLRVEYELTGNEVAAALKAAVQAKYPNADLTSTNCRIVFWDTVIKGRELRDAVWDSTFEPERNETNFSLIVWIDPEETIRKQHAPPPAQQIIWPSGWGVTPVGH